MRRYVLLFICAVTLQACATQAGRQFKAANTTMTNAAMNFKACSATLAADPQFGVVGQHLAMQTPASLEQLADSSLPTEEQITSLLTWHRGIQMCRAQLIQASQESFAFLSGALQQNFANTDAIYLRLAKKQISFGQANQEIAQAKLDGEQRVRQAYSEWSGELREENREELAQRAAAFQAAAASMQQTAAAIQQQQQQQQLINAINRRVTTSCNSFGNQTNCYSQ